MRAIIWTAQFKKDYKTAIKQGKDMELLDRVIGALARMKGSRIDFAIMHSAETGKGTANVILHPIGC